MELVIIGKNNLPTYNDYGDIKGDDGMDLQFYSAYHLIELFFGANSTTAQFLPYGGRWICWDKANK